MQTIGKTRSNSRRALAPASQMNPTTLPVRANADVIEAAYRLWLDNPDGVDPTWRAFFQGFSLGSNGGPIGEAIEGQVQHLSLIHISEPTRQAEISYAVF